ncbi:MAG TPA: ATP-binding protein [Coleofasciculaceae cyanobacterium]|jgi:serine/threonine-protein kinase RsbW
MSQNIDELPEGGMGLKIIANLADQLSYTRTPDHKNCLSIVKNYQQQALPKSSVLERLNWFKHRGHLPQPSNTPLQKINIKVNTDLRALDQVLDWYEQLQNLPISQTVFHQCQLVLAEGFTNAVRHAHQGLDSETPIELEITVFKKSLEIRVWDYGQPFDLEAKLNELKQVDQDILQEEGRGVSFMRQLAEHVSHTQTSDERNCLVIAKRLPSS